MRRTLGCAYWGTCSRGPLFWVIIVNGRMRKYKNDCGDGIYKNIKVVLGYGLVLAAAAGRAAALIGWLVCRDSDVA